LLWYNHEKLESGGNQMHDAIIKRASELINSRTGYIGDGMEGWAVLSLIDENGYPTSSTMTISKADGINWITFLTGAEGPKAERIARSNKACVCLASSEYHVSLVGTVELITDTEVKKENWQDVVTKHYGSDWNDPNWAVLRFTTETYNLFFASDDTEAKGNISEVTNNG
jgi:general stress protein 26